MTIAFLLSTTLLLWIDPQSSKLCGQTIGPLVFLLGALMLLLGPLALLLSPLVCLLGPPFCLRSALLFLLLGCQNPGPSGIIAP
jgi:hypothetical protein